MGKTALATNIAFNAAKKIQESGEKTSVAFFSLEMSSEQLSTRILAEQSRIKSNDIRRGKISEEQFDKFIETSKDISELPLYIDETPAITIAALSNRARRIKRLYGLDMVIIENLSNFINIKSIFKIIFGLKFYPGDRIYKKIPSLNITPHKPIKNIQIDGENLNTADINFNIKLFKKKLQLISPK